jgi:hypothetical protein
VVCWVLPFVLPVPTQSWHFIPQIAVIAAYALAILPFVFGFILILVYPTIMLAVPEILKSKALPWGTGVSAYKIITVRIVLIFITAAIGGLLMEATALLFRPVVYTDIKWLQNLFYEDIAFSIFSIDFYVLIINSLFTPSFLLGTFFIFRLPHWSKRFILIFPGVISFFAFSIWMPHIIIWAIGWLVTTAYMLFITCIMANSHTERDLSWKIN